MHLTQWSASSNRPGTANPSIAESLEYRDEDPADLAAAVGLLSCSYGTPKTGPTGMPENIPPVPPLPAKYASHPRGFAGHQQDAQLLQQRLSQLLAEQTAAAAWVAANPPQSDDQPQMQQPLHHAEAQQQGSESAASRAAKSNAGGWARSTSQQTLSPAAVPQQAQWKWDILRSS